MVRMLVESYFVCYDNSGLLFNGLSLHFLR